MTPSHVDGDRTVRFRGIAASNRAQHVAAAIAVSLLVGLALIGVLTPIAAVAFFAVGAGAGYSLSGSV